MANPSGSQDAVARLLTPISEPEQPTEGNEAEAEETTEAEVVEETEAEAEAETTDAVSEDESEETSEPDETEPQTFEVTVDGEQQSVALDELRLGYMRDADYRKKTQTLGEQRREHERQVAKVTEQLAELEALLQIEAEDFNSPAMLELKEDDPAEYYGRKEALEAKHKRWVALTEANKAQQSAEPEVDLQAEQEQLFSKVTEWLDPETLAKDERAIQLLWNKSGFTLDEQKKFLDHRWLIISRKAALYDQIANAKPASKKDTTPPKSATPGTASDKPDRVSKARKDSRDKLKKTGKMRDAQAALLAGLK